MTALDHYRRPTGSPDLEASIQFLSTAEGGMEQPICSGVRPNHDFGLAEGLNDAQHEYPNGHWARPGETVMALLWLLVPEMQRGRLHPGFQFKVQAGPRIIGVGTVTAVAAVMPNTSFERTREG
jgi:translation elongation factor EF-Tu-like GTPase